MKNKENVKIVMICSSRKRESFFSQYPNVQIVANPNELNHHKPDDLIPEEGMTWRKYLEINQMDDNLLRAYELYIRNEYGLLYNIYNKNFYILSAGWGLVNSDFKLPVYDITFSNQGPDYTVRNTDDFNTYHDFNQLEVGPNDVIYFIGSPDYIPLFMRLTINISNKKIIYWKSVSPLPVPDRYPPPNDTFEYRHFETNRKTGWYYDVASLFINGNAPLI